MKILHIVESYFPSLGGAQEVVRRLSERMVQAGHQVTVATSKTANRKSYYHNGVKIVDFGVSGNSVSGIVGEKQAYQQFLKQSDFDIIMCYAAQQWSADAFFEVIDEVKGSKVFVPCGYSALYDPLFKKYFAELPNILKKFDTTVYLANSYRDINFARKHKLKNIVVIPNGADEEEFDDFSKVEIDEFKAKHGAGGLVISTLGNHTGEKGHVEALRAFKLAPISKATLVIIGGGKKDEGCHEHCRLNTRFINNSRKQLGKRVVLIDGQSRNETVIALKASDLFLFLSNIECSPLVLFETAAAFTPFIATASGNNSEIAEWTEAGVIVRSLEQPNGRVKADLKDTVIKLTRLARNQTLREEMGIKGNKNWQKHYTWEKLSETYLSLYEDIIKKRKS